MHNNKEIQICILEDFPSYMEGILFFTGQTKSQIKKYKIPKKVLEKKLSQKSILKIPLNLMNHNMISPLYEGEEVKILFEDENIIALSKPSKIHSHPLSYDESDNILSFIRMKFDKSLLSVNEFNYDRGLLFRLDYETSGLLILAKKDSIYQKVREHFSEVMISKKYLAVVRGKCTYSGIKISFLKSSGAKNKRIELSTREDNSAREVSSEIRVLDYNSDKDMTLVEVKLHQGARHQIRKQLEDIGYPIYGDPLYSESNADRMYLHCYEYILKINNNEYRIQDENLGLFLRFFNFNS